MVSFLVWHMCHASYSASLPGVTTLVYIHLISSCSVAHYPKGFLNTHQILETPSCGVEAQHATATTPVEQHLGLLQTKAAFKSCV